MALLPIIIAKPYSNNADFLQMVFRDNNGYKVFEIDIDSDIHKVSDFFDKLYLHFESQLT